MMLANKNVLVIAAVALLLIVVAVLFVVNRQAASERVPESAEARFQEMEAKYSDSIGATIERCTRDDETVYRVIGSGGFTAETYFYDEDGQELGEYILDDMVLPDDEPVDPPVDLSGFECEFI